MKCDDCAHYSNNGKGDEDRYKHMPTEKYRESLMEERKTRLDTIHSMNAEQLATWLVTEHGFCCRKYGCSDPGVSCVECCTDFFNEANGGMTMVEKDRRNKAYVMWQYCKDLNDINKAIESGDMNWELKDARDIISIVYEPGIRTYTVIYLSYEKEN